ncbi:MAG: SMC-Scp complex subunit ScpB, partial [bacterium]|nr:SMC-Scp complex subunit ScpB [bacterium]
FPISKRDLEFIEIAMPLVREPHGMSDILDQKIEALLFIGQRPFTIKKLCEILLAKKEDVEASLDRLAVHYTASNCGIVLFRHQEKGEFVTNPEYSKLVQEYTKDEVVSELTRAGVETLTVIAYRGPVAREEIEQIRGVNCAIVLRNLMIRGYVDILDGPAHAKRYTVSMDFLRHLGIARVQDLPDYEELHAHEQLAALLQSPV